MRTNHSNHCTPQVCAERAIFKMFCAWWWLVIGWHIDIILFEFLHEQSLKNALKVMASIGAADLKLFGLVNPPFSVDVIFTLS